MNKPILAALIGGLILFVCQFLSWGVLNLHQPAQQYTPKQDVILSFLEKQGLEEGGYYMPSTPENASMEEYDKVLQQSAGKPWVMLQYHKSLNTNMGINMVRGIIINVLTVFLLCWILGRFRNTGFATVLTASLFTGLIVFLNEPYTNFIWYKHFDIWASLIDAVVGWGLCGLWLGWYFGRNALKSSLQPSGRKAFAEINID